MVSHFVDRQLQHHHIPNHLNVSPNRIDMACFCLVNFNISHEYFIIQSYIYIRFKYLARFPKPKLYFGRRLLPGTPVIYVYACLSIRFKILFLSISDAKLSKSTPFDSYACSHLLTVTINPSKIIEMAIERILLLFFNVLVSCSTEKLALLNWIVTYMESKENRKRFAF